MNQNRIVYEYETLTITSGAVIWQSDLDRLGEMGYHLIAIVPISRIEYDGEKSIEIKNGSQIIFQRPKILKEKAEHVI